MAFRNILTRLVWRMERWAERAFPRRSPEQPIIEPYLGYATTRGLVVRGRVLAALRRAEPDPGQSRWTNLRQMLSLFATREVAGVEVIAGDAPVSGITDEEGYFTIHLPLGDTSPGWHDAPARIAGVDGTAVSLPALVPDPEAAFGVISDIDDTIMETGAYSLARNLWTTFTGSALTRRVFPDAVELLRRLHNGRNPVFYVSSSPWNLHHFLSVVFARAGLVRGPKFLRDLGVGENQLISGRHCDHKGAAIDTIMAANPELEFVLIGDTGQHDAEVYLNAAERHPGRVRRIILRAPGPGADERDKAFATRAAALGIDVSIGRDYRRLIRVLPGEDAEVERPAAV